MTLGKWVKVARDAAESGKSRMCRWVSAACRAGAAARWVRDDKSAIAELRMRVEVAKKVATWFAKGSQ